MTFGISIYNEQGADMVPVMPLFRYVSEPRQMVEHTLGVTRRWKIPDAEIAVPGTMVALRLPENIWYCWARYGQFYGVQDVDALIIPSPTYRLIRAESTVTLDPFGFQVFDSSGKELLGSSAELVTLHTGDLVDVRFSSSHREHYLGSNRTSGGYIVLQSLLYGLQMHSTTDDYWEVDLLEIKRVGQAYYIRYVFQHDPHAPGWGSRVFEYKIRGIFTE